MPGSIVLIRIIVVNYANCLMRSQQLLKGFYGGRKHCKLSTADNRGGCHKTKVMFPTEPPADSEF